MDDEYDAHVSSLNEFLLILQGSEGNFSVDCGVMKPKRDEFHGCCFYLQNQLSEINFVYMLIA